MAVGLAAAAGVVARRAVVFAARKAAPAVSQFFRSELGRQIKGQVARRTPRDNVFKSKIFGALDTVRRSERIPRRVRRAASIVQNRTLRVARKPVHVAGRTVATGQALGNIGAQEARAQVLKAGLGHYGRVGKSAVRGAAAASRKYRAFHGTKTGRFTRAAVKTGVTDIAVFKAADQLEQWLEQLERKLEQKQMSEQEKNEWLDRLESGVETLNENMEVLRDVMSMMAIRSLINRSTRLIRRLRRRNPPVPDITPATAETFGKRMGEQAQKYKALYQGYKPEFYGSALGSIGAVGIESEHPIEAFTTLRGGDQGRLVSGFTKAAVPGVGKVLKAPGVQAVRKARGQ